MVVTGKFFPGMYTLRDVSRNKLWYNKCRLGGILEEPHRPHTARKIEEKCIFLDERVARFCSEPKGPRQKDVRLRPLFFLWTLLVEMLKGFLFCTH